MEITDTDRARILAGLFELATSHSHDSSELTRIFTLVVKLGGDPEAVLFAPA